MKKPVTEGESEQEGEDDGQSNASSSHNASTNGARILTAPVHPGENHLVHLEQRGGEVARSLLSYLQWLRTRQLEWHNMQAVLVEEIQITAISAAMQMMMLVQALNVARGNYLPVTVERENNYEALPPSEATMRAHSMVGEIIEHCDVLSASDRVPRLPAQPAYWLPDQLPTSEALKRQKRRKYRHSVEGERPMTKDAIAFDRRRG